MKRDPIMMAAQWIRSKLRPYTAQERTKILLLAVQDVDEDLDVASELKAPIEAALAKANGNISRAAELLKWDRRTLQRNMIKLDIPSPHGRGRLPKKHEHEHEHETATDGEPAPRDEKNSRSCDGSVQKPR